ncbi:MAG: exonuclease SbcCD subunit D C-terminal domain-containing protein [Gammaproteobacteria bacterium]|nr:exonuclease SbcCD subunit D C-terminal domain-containing protein [Gammaproteobacteria bacterium]
MRILHTSDWHLGQHFIGKSRAAEHQAFFSWLKLQIISLDIDVVLVAGDIFDTATPPSYARELYHQLIVDLQPTAVQLVLLGGNHDSVAVLQESAALLKCLHTSVVPGYQTANTDIAGNQTAASQSTVSQTAISKTAISQTPASQTDHAAHLIPLRRKNGEVGAVLAAVPFLRPRDLSQRDDGKSQPGQTAAEKTAQLQQQISTVYQELYQGASQLAATLAADIQAKTGKTVALPLVATGHLTTVGASSSDSVREIYIGTLEALPASCLPPFAYIALGHIHQAQKVAGSDFIRYSGSPIPLSFDEAKQQKQLVLVEFLDDAVGSSNTTPNVSSIDIPCFQPLLSLKSDLASLKQQLQPALAQLGDKQQLWLELVISGETALLSDLQLQLQEQLAGLPVELLKLRRERQTQAGNAAPLLEPSLLELTPADVLQSRLAAETLSDELQQRLTMLHQQAFDMVLHQETSEAESSSASGTDRNRLTDASQETF